MKAKESTYNMCDSCELCIAYCDQEVIFGNGVGEDNVIDCSGYSPKFDSDEVMPS